MADANVNAFDLGGAWPYRTFSGSTLINTRALSLSCVKTLTPWTSLMHGESLLCTPLQTAGNVALCPHSASMIWILGEYCDRIDGVDEQLTPFVDNFHDENAQVCTSSL